MEKNVDIRDKLDEGDGVIENDVSREAYWTEMGFEVELIEGYLEREKLENLAYEGYPVPDDFLISEERKHTRGKKEKDLYRRMKMMERLEQERTDPLSHPDPDKRAAGRKMKCWGEIDQDEVYGLPDRVMKI